jgi:hypothetical protein
LWILRGRNFKIIVSPLSLIWKTTTISCGSMSRRCHVIILNWMRDTCSMILTWLSIDVRVIIILLGSSSRHHLIVLIHLILVWIVATSTHLRIRWVSTWVLITEAHWCRSWHPSGAKTIVLLRLVGHSTSWVTRLLRKPAATCWH